MVRRRDGGRLGVPAGRRGPRTARRNSPLPGYRVWWIRCRPRRVLGTACGKDGAKLHRGGFMATTFSRMSKWLMVGGGALVALSLIVVMAITTTQGGSVFAQATPVR